jgi:two-component system response regulator CpxR
MSSIALFPCIPTLDSGIIGELSKIFTLKVYTDQNLFGETAAQFGADSQRLKKMMFGRTSVFNQFTLEKEDVVNMFFQVLADKLCDPEQYLFHGFLTSLIPPKRKEFLRVVVIDTTENRIDRAMHEGLSKNEAKKNILTHDVNTFRWTNFLFKKGPYDSSLYDMVIPAENRNHRQVTKEIISSYLQTSVIRPTKFPIEAHAPKISA